MPGDISVIAEVAVLRIYHLVNRFYFDILRSTYIREFICSRKVKSGKTRKFLFVNSKTFTVLSNIVYNYVAIYEIHVYT